jgi:hypothetical protein
MGAKRNERSWPKAAGLLSGRERAKRTLRTRRPVAASDLAADASSCRRGTTAHQSGFSAGRVASHTTWRRPLLPFACTRTSSTVKPYANASIRTMCLRPSTTALSQCLEIQSRTAITIAAMRSCHRAQEGGPQRDARTEARPRICNSFARRRRPLAHVKAFSELSASFVGLRSSASRFSPFCSRWQFYLSSAPRTAHRSWRDSSSRCSSLPSRR